MTTFDIQNYLKEKRELIDSYLESYFSVTRKPSVLHEAMKYSLFAGGKRIRPAVGIFSAVDKIKVGLQQLMAGARSWQIRYINRNDLMSLTEECAKVTGIPYVMEAYREEALQIIDA